VDLDLKLLSKAIPDFLFPPSREEILQKVSDIFI